MSISMNEPSIAIIVVTYNGEDYIDECLKSCLAVADRRDIFVVDNNSTDNTWNLVLSYDINGTRLSENIGFGQANNVGMSKALQEGRFEYCFLLNQDAYLQKDAFEKFFLLPDFVRASVVGFMQLNGRGNEIDFILKENYLNHRKCPNFWEDGYFQRSKQHYEVSFVNAAAWMVPVSILRSVGGFNPFFFHYGEDDNFIHRLNFHSHKLHFAPHCVVRHDRLKKSREKSKFFAEKILVERRLKIDIANPLNQKSKLGWMVHVIFELFLARRPVDFQRVLIFFDLLRKGELKRGIKFRKIAEQNHEFLWLEN